MVNQWISQLTIKKVIMLLVALFLAVYVIWYVIDALDGFDPNYNPSGVSARGSSSDGSGAKVGSYKAFDPSKQTPEAAQSK